MNMSDSIKEVLYTEEQLQARVKELGAQITKALISLWPT